MHLLFFSKPFFDYNVCVAVIVYCIAIIDESIVLKHTH